MYDGIWNDDTKTLSFRILTYKRKHFVLLSVFVIAYQSHQDCSLKHSNYSSNPSKL
jgi:hypothetical protein